MINVLTIFNGDFSYFAIICEYNGVGLVLCHMRFAVSVEQIQMELV